MTTEQPKQRSFSSLWWVLAVAIVLWLAWALFVPDFIRSGTTKTNGIINNLRQLDGAKQQWALDHGRTGAVLVTIEDIAPYVHPSLLKAGSVKAIAGERYSLKTLAESPEAQLTHQLDGRPTGTVLRLTTNSFEIILGPTNGSRQ
jgi:hypothetical protein